jgi:hypothetical protein
MGGVSSVSGRQVGSRVELIDGWDACLVQVNLKFHLVGSRTREENSKQLLACHVNFRCIYFQLKMVVRPKHAAHNFNKIVNNY